MAYTYRRSKYAPLVRGESVECFAAHVLREKKSKKVRVGAEWAGGTYVLQKQARGFSPWRKR